MSEEIVFTIRHDENKRVGFNDLFIGSTVPDDIYKALTKKKEDGHKSWINDYVVVDFDENTHKINFMEYYPLRLSRVKFGDYYLLEESLNMDIKNLLKYSYCVHNDYDRYYFPRLNILIWTNKEPSKPAYSVAIYAYGIYDNDFDEKTKNLINCEANIKNGEVLICSF